VRGKKQSAYQEPGLKGAAAEWSECATFAAEISLEPGSCGMAALPVVQAGAQSVSQPPVPTGKGLSR